MDAPVPEKDCDLVMKGGVTSGIVYPPAILALKDKYRFRCIGGASAGAIAAAVAAAAEFGRESGRPGSGFAGLETLQTRISTQGFMRDLFQPTRAARPLFRTVLDAAFVSRTPSKKRTGFAHVTYVLGGTARNIGGALAVLKNNPFSSLAGALVAVLLVTWLGGWSVWQAAWWRVGFAALLVFAGAVLGGALNLARVLFFTLPGQRFGMCPGLGAKGDTRNVLTSWLADEIDTLAGRALDHGPLTFADLKGKTARDKSGATRDAGINLQMVTSNLSHQMPLLLPFETHELMFKRDEMAELFPERALRYLVDHAGEKHPDATEHGPRPAPPAGYHYLPRENELPVIVATRMSLSFPVLLQAVPLYVVRVSAHAARGDDATTPFAESDLMRLWFSDGGISSNFPIHLFDAWLPGRPTFGINLGDVPAEHLVEPKGQRAAASTAAATGPQYFDRAQFGSVGVDAAAPQDREPDEELAGQVGIPDVYLPKPNRVLPPRWVDIRGLLGFLGQVFATAQNYHDTTQMMLPGCRERVAQVLLAKDEGGLNLDMPEATLKGIVDKGRRAGELLHDDFNFDTHAWVRFRVLMDKLEQRLMEWRSRVSATTPGYVGLIEHNATRAGCYRMDGPQERRAERRMRSLALLVQVWKAHDDERESEVLAKLEALLAPDGAPLQPYVPEDADRVFTRGAPRPKSVLRVTPLL